jgi:hypothetical protein
MASPTNADWTQHLKIERRIQADFDGYGIYTLSHNECVGECLTQESAEYYASLIAQEMAPKSTSAKRTEAKLIAWTNSHRRMYADGQLGHTEPSPSDPTPRGEARCAEEKE